MGDMADYDIEQGMDMWMDHCAGHPQFPDPCPYCEDEDAKSEQGNDNRKPDTRP